MSFYEGRGPGTFDVKTTRSQAEKYLKEGIPGAQQILIKVSERNFKKFSRDNKPRSTSNKRPSSSKNDRKNSGKNRQKHVYIDKETGAKAPDNKKNIERRILE